MIKRSMPLFLTLLIAAALLSFAILGSFSRMVGDDYHSGWIGREYGAIGKRLAGAISPVI